MGCTSSKLDDLPAVALCRDRCAFLEAAIQQRYALSESHVAYTHSLRGIGHSLHLFINLHHRLSAAGGADSPALNLPPVRKGDPVDGGDSPKKEKLPAHHHQHHHSGSGHLEFDSDSEDEDDDDDDEDEDELGSLHHSDHSSPLHQHHLGGGQAPVPIGYMEPGFTRYPNPQMMGPPYSGGFMHMNYMKNKATPPSVVYEQRPMNPQRVYMGEPSSSSTSAYYPYSYPPNSNASNYPYFGYQNYPGGPGPGPGPGIYGSSPPPYGSSSPSGASSSKPPPPPPSPPRTSTWDFLNPFDTYDKYYPTYTPSRDSRELREEEGIPELEDEDFQQHETVREVHVNQKFVPPKPVVANMEESTNSGVGTSGGRGGGGGGGGGDASLYQTRPSVSVQEEGMEYEVHEVEKKVVEDGRSEEQRRSNAAAREGGGGGGPRAVPEVAKEIEVQFVRAAESGSDVSKMLEVGKHPYGLKHAASKMLQGVTPSLSVVSSQPTASRSSEAASSSAGPAYLDIEEELASRSRNLSSTLHKLHLWEKKLYHEVKAEEKLRVVHERKLRKLKRMDEKGAEAHKVDSARKLLRSLSTKIRIAIQVVDKISVTINKIRDDELWPQLNELIHGLTRMWKSMLECHRSQCQAIREARGLGPIKSGRKLGDDHLEATRMLGHELINWILGFSSWVSTQKGYVKALNNWLMKCLLYEPEETPDGIAPFSPGRIGAPTIFVTCNQWSQALDRISEKEVIEAMRSFTTSVLQLWEQDRLEMREKVTENKDSEKKVRNLDREEQKIQKEIQALEKKMVLVAVPGEGNNGLSLSGHVVYQSDTSSDSLQGSLQRIFEAMESFTAESMRAYEELLQRAEEESDSQEPGGD